MNQRMPRRQFLRIAGLGGLAWLSQRVHVVQADYWISLPIVKNDAVTTPLPTGLNADPPAQTQRLIFIHHSTGQNWLADGHGNLGQTLKAANYFVSDTNYGWGPSSIGNSTDIGNWYDWFLGPSHNTYLSALYAEAGQNCSYSRLNTNPAGENSIVMFKPCFPNSTVYGSPNDPPTTGTNPINSQSAGSSSYTVGNIKALYLSLLGYFATRQDKLFVIILAPPLVQGATTSSQAANARAVNTWLVNDLLSGYTNSNVAIFDFYNVLTSNGGSPNISDAGATTGNHHRFRSNAIEYLTNQGSNYCMYGSGDSHPTPAGGQKASAEFVPLLNIAYHRWKNN